MKANQEWFTVLELTGMPGMQGTSRGVLRAVKKMKYVSRQRAYGKGLEYALKSLPAVTQDYLKDVAEADAKARKSKKKEPLAQADAAQVAINSVAKAAVNLTTMQVQRDWLMRKQSSALFWMNNSTGDAFKKYRDELIALSNAIQLTRQFEQEARG